MRSDSALRKGVAMADEFTPLAGERVLLRRFTPSDIGAVYIGWLNDPCVTRYSNQRFHRHDAESAAAYLAGFGDGPSQFLLIEVADRPVGTMSLHVAPQHQTVDLGILLGDPASRSKGLGLEAWMLALDWALGTAGLRKATAGTLAVNAPMLGIMHRSGMTLEAIRRAQEIVDGRPVDMHYFARFRADA